MKPMEIRELYDRLYRYCYMKTHHPQTAEDITQETFLRFLKNYRGRGMAENQALLYTIARNLCTDYYRSAKEEPWDPLRMAEGGRNPCGMESGSIGRSSMGQSSMGQDRIDESGIGQSHVEPGSRIRNGMVQDDMDRHITRLALEAAMEQLEETDREALFFRYVMELPAGEVAEILGISRFQLYRKEKRALRQLQKQLNRRDFYE